MTLVIFFIIQTIPFSKTYKFASRSLNSLRFEQLKSSSTHYVPDSLVWTVSSVVH